MTIKLKYTFLLFIALLIMLFISDIIFGAVSIPFGELIKIVFNKQGSNNIFSNIIINFRIPKAITALLAGGGLSVCGLILQTYFRNPLADLYVLGVSSGASFAVALVTMASGVTLVGIIEIDYLIQNIGTVFAAGMGASVVLIIISIISKKVNNYIALLILGIMLGHLIGAFENVLKSVTEAESLKEFTIWGFGNFGNVLWNDIPFFSIITATGIVLAFALSKQLNALLFGTSFAQSIGINTIAGRTLIIICAGLLGGVITAYCGPIAFLGIAVPHLARNILKVSDHRILIPGVFVIGGGLALLCDLLSQVPGGSNVLPINVVTSIIGSPIVIWVILQQQSKLKQV